MIDEEAVGVLALAGAWKRREDAHAGHAKGVPRQVAAQALLLAAESASRAGLLVNDVKDRAQDRVLRDDLEHAGAGNVADRRFIVEVNRARIGHRDVRS